jgi:hypothetical protein
MAEGNSGDPRVVEVPETEARLEAFKGALLLALSRLPGATRSKFAHEVEQQARQLRSMRGGDPDRLAFHLEGFARTARLTTPSIAVEVIKRRRTS